MNRYKVTTNTSRRANWNKYHWMRIKMSGCCFKLSLLFAQRTGPFPRIFFGAQYLVCLLKAPRNANRAAFAPSSGKCAGNGNTHNALFAFFRGLPVEN